MLKKALYDLRELRFRETSGKGAVAEGQVLEDDDVKERTWAMGDAHRLEQSDTALIIHSISMPHGRDDVGLDEDDRSMQYVAELPSHARILEYNRQDIRDILLDVTVKDENDLIQWEVFSGVRVDNLYPDHTGVALELSDSFETHT